MRMLVWAKSCVQFLLVDVSLCEFSIQLESHLWKRDTTDGETW